MQRTENQFKPELKTVKQLQPDIPVNLRWALQKHYTALLESGVVIRYGKKILIDEEKFWGWLRSRGRYTSSTHQQNSGVKR